MNAIRNFLYYTWFIAKQLSFLIPAAIGIVGFVIQLFIAIPLPQWIYLLVAVIGFLIASYQVYRDTGGTFPPPVVKPSPFELLPISFEIGLSRDIPQIEIWLYAVNHQPKDLVFQSIAVTDFHLSGGPGLDNIPSSDMDCIPPKCSKRVLCRRRLLEAEVRRIIENARRGDITNANYLLTAHAQIGRKAHSYKTPSSCYMNGLVSGVPDLPDKELKKEPVIIKEAYYGVLSDPQKTCEVTSILQNIVSASAGRFHLSGTEQQYGNLFSDPAPYERKRLEVVFVHDEKEISITVPEGTELTLPLRLS